MKKLFFRNGKQKRAIEHPFSPAIIFNFSVYYHGNSWLLPESILLPDSTIFPPIAILSAALKKHKNRGPPTTPMNPLYAQNPLILSHSSILSPASTPIPMASIGNSRLCRCEILMTFTPGVSDLPLFTPFTPPNSTFDKRDSTNCALTDKIHISQFGAIALEQP